MRQKCVVPYSRFESGRSKAWQDCAVLKRGLSHCFGFESRQAAETNVCVMAQKKIDGLIWVREDDEYEYYASSMNEY